MQLVKGKNILITIAIILLFLWLFWKFADFFEYIYYLRVPILGMLFLVLLPIFSGNSLLRNLFIFSNKWQLTLAIPAVLIAGLTVTNVFETILINAPNRFDFVAPPLWQSMRNFLLNENTSLSWHKSTLLVLSGKEVCAILLGSLICITVIKRSARDNQITGFFNEGKTQTDGWILSGILTGIFAIFLTSLIDFTTIQLTSYINIKNFAFEESIANSIQELPVELTQGYLTTTRGVAGSHLSNLILFLLLLVTYLIFGVIGYLVLAPSKKSPDGKPSAQVEFNIPTLLYLMLITIGITLFFGAVTFFLDYYRIPVILLFLIFSASIYWGWNVDHFYQLEELAANRRNLITIDKQTAIANFQEALANRLKNQAGDDRTLVVVCASGGGIQAAGWTVKVLTGIQKALGANFTKAIGLISSVSGGSVGTMYYLDHFEQNQGYPPEEELKDIFNSATANSLDSTGWGLAYLDLWRFMGFPWILRILKLGKKDRGTAIERDWRGNLQKNPQASLDTWRHQALAGTIPIPVFNSTLVSSGYRFLLSPLTFTQQSEQGQKYRDFNKLYGQYNYDLKVTTAARLSATFPYVTPICRNSYPNKYQPPDSEQNNYHVADGGYFDNFGVFTAVEWLDKVVLKDLREKLKIKKVIILQINAFHASAPKKENPKEKKGWLMSLAGPLLAVFNVRSSTQTDRNNLEIEILREKWQKRTDNLEIHHVYVEFPQIDKSSLEEIEKKYGSHDGDGKKWNLFLDAKGEYKPPLSWKLSEFEKAMIQYAWDKVKSESKVVEKIRQIWDQ